MPDVPITIATNNYDRVRGIRDGSVKVEGCDVSFFPMYPEEVFFRTFRYKEFDVPELSFSSYLRTVADGTSEYVGIPAFLSRIFRHSGIYVREGAGITKPEDLVGKRIGLPEYQITAVVWIRGMLQHEYGVLPTQINWFSGGQEEAGRDERTPLAPIPGLSLTPIPHDKTLVGMLRDGELDALFTARPPSSFLAHEPHIQRLFKDIRGTEQAYWSKTQLFPIMHLVGLRKSLHEKHPWLATSICKAFCEAKALAMRDLHDVNALITTLPWLDEEALATERLMGKDFWRYGVKENTNELEALTQYSFEQGLTSRKVQISELFAPSLYEVSKV
jgi:4,5-dihydroxyphthalate decarboxylase